jgi:RNA-binding protein YlmH
MPDREFLLKKAGKPEDRLFISKILDRAELSERIGKPVHTGFLDPYQQSLVEKVFNGMENIEYDFYGGYSGAERAVTIFRPDFYEPGEAEYDSYLKLLSIKPNSREGLTHRDYLGSLMGLGIKREKTGDIIVGTETCSIVVLNEIAGYIAGNLAKVGNTGVSVEIGDTGGFSAPEPKAREIKATVASLRLDCIASPGFGISRSRAAEFIRAGRLNHNWVQAEDPDRPVREGDVLSIRGKGRVTVEAVGGRTKKDRIGIVLKKFV